MKTIMLHELTNAIDKLPYLDKNVMTLEHFLKTFCVNKENLISILSHDEQLLYFMTGKEMSYSKTAYMDHELKCMVMIGVNDLSKIVSNWACYNNNVRIYIKEA